MPADHRVVPPLPDWPRSEADILSELEFRPLGVELWLSVRKVRLWSETPPQRRKDLFHRRPADGARARRRAALLGAPELREALRTCADLSDRPERVDEVTLGRACSRVADWAAERSHVQTAVHYAMAAAVVRPEDAESTNLAALMHRQAGDWKRAEQCYPRAIILAHRRKEWVEYICGHIGSAALLYARGMNLGRAVRHLETASRKADEEGMAWLASHVLHDSMLLLLEREEFEAAEAEAERATELYPLHDRRFPFFVADYALIQLMQRRYAVAQPLLKLCLDVIDQPAARGVITSMLARTHAGMGEGEEYDRVRKWACESAERYPVEAAAAYYHLAEGARECRFWPEAESYASRACERAEAKGDRMIVHLARQLLKQARARETPPPAPGGPSRGDLGRVLSVRLERWNPEEHRGPTRTLFRNQWVA
jgi:tetratricopeptide (TPR) repeat protein